MKVGDYIEFVSNPIVDDAGELVDFTVLTLKASIKQGRSSPVSASSVSGNSVGVVTAVFDSATTRSLMVGLGILQIQVIDGADRENVIITQNVNFGASNFV